jgi:hypothetical protein
MENPQIDAFLEDIWKVCESHQMAILHEDKHGAFLVVPITMGNRDWLMDAMDETSDEPDDYDRRTQEMRDYDKRDAEEER